MTEKVIEICQAKYESYAFTVKKLGPADINVDYHDVISVFTANGNVKEVTQEVDKQGKLHIHGIIVLKKGFFRKKLFLQGYHYKLCQLYDESGWVDYIMKQCDIQPSAKAYSNMYLFDPQYEVSSH